MDESVNDRFGNDWVFEEFGPAAIIDLGSDDDDTPLITVFEQVNEHDEST